MKLFGNGFSTCTRKVLFTLHETGTPFELVSLDFMKGEHKSPEHVARQPFGQMPAIDDDGFVLFESRAIARYVDDKAGHKLTPKDVKGRALMEQFISIEQSDFSPAAMKFISQYTFNRPQTDDVLAGAKAMLETCYALIDKQTTSQAFLAGNELSIADICYAPYIEYMHNSPAKDILAARKHAQAWWNRVSERTAWRKTSGRA